MPRPSTRGERVVLLRYAEAAGGRDALIGWIDEALKEGKQRAGRKRYKERYSIDTYERLAETKPKDRTKIFEQLIDEGRIEGIGSRPSIVKRAKRNFRKGEKQLVETMSKFKAAFDKLRFTDDQLAQLKDFIRAQIESRRESLQRVNTRGYTCPSDTQSDGSKHDTPRSGALSPPKRIRPREH
jgi:hypothetical protein